MRPSAANELPWCMRFGRGRGKHVREAWWHVCMCRTDARCAPAAADALWIRVARACSAHADDGCVAGIDRQDVREHRGHAGELLRERFAMYLYTIESVPFRNSYLWIA